MAEALYDIAEPGESKKKEACPPGQARAIGIDLGTTNSLVAVVREGTPVCLPDGEGRRLLPSAVRYRDAGAAVVGFEALREAAQHPRDTIVSVKRFMGRGPRDAETTLRFTPYEFSDDTKDEKATVVRFKVAGHREVTPIEVSAEILRVLKERAEAELGGTLDGAVITVPAYFDDAQRQATRDAGRIAGLEVLRLLNEPTAAALAYGLDKKSEGTFAVYDLGGGTFDISILKLTGGVFEVKSTGGDTALGGDDFDRALAELVIARTGGVAPASPSAQRALLDQARAIKHALTTETMADGITRAEFEAAIAPIIQRTASACRRALKDAGLNRGQLDGVILVGGATRVPAVRAFVAELFGREPLGDIDPDQVVALGAAVQADLLAGSGPREDVLLLDVIPLSLGLELMGGVVEKIIPRNSTIPTGAKQTFTTYAENQTGFDLHVVQGERETVAECRSLARFQLKGIPPMAAGMARLEVTFLVDADGILRVMAKELTTGKESAVEVKPSYGLSEEQIEKMLFDSYEFAEQDLNARQLAEARVEAERILSALRNALAVDGKLLDAAEQVVIDELAAAVEAAARGEDHRLIRTRTEALDLGTKTFAERRMNQGITRAIGGHKVDEIEKAVEHAEGTARHEGHVDA
jgi:molecular chaperone HscA